MDLGGLFGKGSIGEQLFIWGVLNNLVSALIGPGIQELTNLVNQAAPLVPLDPGDLASAVGRGLIDQTSGQNEAKLSGISNASFDDLARWAQHAPDMGVIVQALQRGLLIAGNSDGLEISFNGALTNAGIPEEWHGIIQDLAVSIPTGAEVMNAWLEGQITESEANTRWTAAGMDPTWFQNAYNANGQAPTPVQALELWNRGIIPQSGTGPGAVSYEQAFLEGPWRNKWLPAFESLREYFPPPRTVTAMYHQGQLTHDEAAQYLTWQGLKPSLVTAYLSKSTTTTTAVAKKLTEGNIEELYSDGILTESQAVAHLVAAGYSSDDAALILKLADVKATTAALTAGISAVKTRFQAGKLTKPQAVALLVQLEVPAAQASSVVDTWSLTASHTVKLLTPQQIGEAFFVQIFTEDEAIAQLVGLGYDEFDAWVVLSLTVGKALPGKPAMD